MVRPDVRPNRARTLPKSSSFDELVNALGTQIGAPWQVESLSLKPAQLKSPSMPTRAVEANCQLYPACRPPRAAVDFSVSPFTLGANASMSVTGSEARPPPTLPPT